MKVRWTAPALGDLEAAGDHIARDNPSAAGRVATAILDQTDALGAHPHIGRAGRVPGTRELVVTATPFITAYRVRDQQVEVLAVFHGARRWPDSFSGS